MSETIKIAAAAIMNSAHQMLLVRKRGTTAYMQPGGMIDMGETPIQALRRELGEELNLHLPGDDIEFIGDFQAEAANEPNCTVSAAIFRLDHDGPFEPAAEIEAITWYPDAQSGPIELAPLTRDHVLPASGV